MYKVYVSRLRNLVKDFFFLLNLLHQRLFICVQTVHQCACVCQEHYKFRIKLCKKNYSRRANGIYVDELESGLSELGKPSGGELSVVMLCTLWSL